MFLRRRKEQEQDIEPIDFELEHGDSEQILNVIIVNSTLKKMKIKAYPPNIIVISELTEQKHNGE